MASKPTETSLSGLVDGMLKAQREMSKDNIVAPGDKDANMPLLGRDGVYHILSEEQLNNFQAAHSDKLIIMKFSSPMCQACRMLQQKFRGLHRDATFEDVVLADISVSNNKSVQDSFRDFVTSQLKVRKILTIRFFHHGEQLDGGDFGCDPEDGCLWNKLKPEMATFIEDYKTKMSAAFDEHAATTANDDVSSDQHIHHNRPSSQPFMKRIGKLFGN